MYKFSLVDQEIFLPAPQTDNLLLPPLLGSETTRNLKHYFPLVITRNMTRVEVISKFLKLWDDFAYKYCESNMVIKVI